VQLRIIHLIIISHCIWILSIGSWLWCLCHFQLYFSYIVAVSFIGGGTGVPRETTDLVWVGFELSIVSGDRHWL